MNLLNQDRLLCTTNSKGNAAMVPHLSPMMRCMTRIVLALICFVWYSSYVHAAVERITKEPAQNQIENYYPLGAELEKLRANLKHLLREANQPANQGKANSSTQIENLALIKELDEALRGQMSTRLAHLQKEKSLNRISLRQKLNNEAYERDMNALYQKLETIEKIGADASSQREKRKAITQALTLLKSPLSRPHESYSNDLDFIGSAPRDIYSTQAQINSLLGTDDGSYTTTDSATDITQTIIGKVAELGTDPLNLYNWVHDTIRWIPSFGVMQGADYTLQSEQGNAFDTSSLLISLLRAAGHEARYKYGVVNIPADIARNWVGNVKNAAAVANLMSQGGIPQHQYSYGGDVEEIQLEHVWVEVKQGDTWYSLDPSFKQYTYTDGMDLENQVAFDAQGLLTTLEEGAVSNESEGWVQGVDASLIETELANYQTELETYLNNNAPNATLGDVLGLQTINPSTALSLEEAVPSYEIEFSATVDHLPETLFHKFHYQVGSAISYDLGQSFSWGDEYFELSDFTTNLVGKDIALSFRPATAEDEAAIESYLPDTIETVDDLPNTLPAGAIQMVGELTIDGEVVHSTPAVSLGESLKTRLGFAPAQQAFKFTENNVVAGQYQAIGIDMQGISPNQLEDLQANLESTQTQLEAENTASLTKHDVVGNIIQAGVQGYLAMTYATDRIAAQAAGVAYYRQPSYGTFSTQMEVSYLINGTPNQVNFTGVVMDIDRLNNNVEEKKNCYEGWVAFNRASGMRNSAYEHQIPEQLFSTDTEQAEGVSTAKALAIAMAQGQKIYTLTSANASQLNFITIDDGARAEIQSALLQGLEVTVHETPITVKGWQGSGYSILDTEYGVGAYKITGGASGGFALGVDNLFSLAFSFMELIFGIGKYNDTGVVMKQLSKALEGAFKGLGAMLTIVTGIFDIFEKCKGIGFAGMGALLGLLMGIVSIAFIQFTPGGKLVNYLIDSAISSFATMFADLIFNVVKDDCTP